MNCNLCVVICACKRAELIFICGYVYIVVKRDEVKYTEVTVCPLSGGSYMCSYMYTAVKTRVNHTCGYMCDMFRGVRLADVNYMCCGVNADREKCLTWNG